MNSSHSVANSVSKMQDMEAKKRTLHTSRDDRATSEQCLDPRTRLMLFKMLSNGMLEKIDGCLSTGKEANVYYAKAGRNSSTAVTEFAIKIYKTSILVFKDRDKYVAGEHRWRNGYCEIIASRCIGLLWVFLLGSAAFANLVLSFFQANPIPARWSRFGPKRKCVITDESTRRVFRVPLRYSLRRTYC